MDKDGNPIASWRDKFDIITVDKWECPEENDARILTMPNVPFPIQGEGCQPRTIYGPTVWNYMRKQCYSDADDTCEICGYQPDNPRYRHSHELYSYDYSTQTATFERCVCLCYTCHIMALHTGRALTLYKQGSPMFTKEKLLAGAEHAFTIIGEYNAAHPDQEPLRLFSTWVDYMKQPELKAEMERLIEKHDIKFYKVSNKWYDKKHWNNWKLILNDTEYKTPYATRNDWEKAMTENNKQQKIGMNKMRKAIARDFHKEIEEILTKPIDKTKPF